MEIINQIIQSIITQFDFTFCVVVNVLTYFLITCFINIANGNITRSLKRILLLVSIIIIGVLYYVTNSIEIKVLINSIVLTPVSWSWIFKPICKKLGFDYKDIDNNLNN